VPGARSARRYPVSASIVSVIAAVLDGAAILGAGGVLYAALIPFHAESLEVYLFAICFVAVSSLLLFHFAGLYEFDALLRPLASADRILISLASAVLFVLAAAFAFKVSETFSRVWMASFAAGASVTVVLARFALSRLLQRLSQVGAFRRNVVFVGHGNHIRRLLDRIKTRQEFLTVSGVFVDEPEAAIGGIPVLGTPADVSVFVRHELVDDVVIALPWSEEARIMGMVEGLRELPVNVHLGADLIGLSLDFSGPPGHFRGAPVFSVFGRPLSGWGLIVKTTFDYVVGSMLLLIASPIMAFVAVAIKLDSPGPVLFKQLRFGFNNRPFHIYKFRSMRDAPAPDGKTVQARRDDERVTRLGRILRQTSLDELPQLFNVLNGTMSLVGPRPHAIDHNWEYSQKIRGYFARHRVKPGITGWAQVQGLRGETDTPEKMAARVRADVYYIENWSLLFDLYILFLTLWVPIRRRNAY
jgi:Undecaprenyl-phosphate glucose phosphotransferase